MVNYCVRKMKTTCSPMVGQFFDTMIVASSDKEWLQRPIKYKCWKLFRATLNYVWYKEELTYWSQMIWTECFFSNVFPTARNIPYKESLISLALESQCSHVDKSTSNKHYVWEFVSSHCISKEYFRTNSWNKVGHAITQNILAAWFSEPSFYSIYSSGLAFLLASKLNSFVNNLSSTQP